MLLKLQKVKIKEENEGGQQTVATVGGNRQEKRKGLCRISSMRQLN